MLQAFSKNDEVITRPEGALMVLSRNFIVFIDMAPTVTKVEAIDWDGGAGCPQNWVELPQDHDPLLSEKYLALNNCQFKQLTESDIELVFVLINTYKTDQMLMLGEDPVSQSPVISFHSAASGLTRNGVVQYSINLTNWPYEWVFKLWDLIEGK